MKKNFALLICFTVFTVLPCFGEALDNLSSVPTWVKHKELLKREASWFNFTEQRNFSSVRQTPSHGSEQNSFLQIPNRKSRVELLFFKVDDNRFGSYSLIKESSKDFVLPLPDDFNSLNRSLLRLRPSLVVGNDWRVTIPKIKMTDGKLEGRILFRKNF